jgi:ATP-dependent RNA helicase RhlB
MNEPEKLVVETEFITAAKVRQKVYYPSDEEKLPLLIALLSRSEGARTMVFVNTKAFVERVARALEKAGYRVGVLSGDVPQKKRESLLKKFQAGQLEILVATDVAARGLHIDGVSHVYNYDLPFDAEDYVHRIGRTARLGAEGDAISFACERYAMSLPDIEAYIDQKLPTEQVTAEMLIALPRPKREAIAGEADSEGESIGAIFKEAREQRAADEARRGGGTGRGGPRGRGEAHGRSGDKPRSPRPKREAGETKPAEAAPVEAAPQTPPVPATSGLETTERAPRKRRRRRGGRRIEDGAEAAGTAQPAAAMDGRAAGSVPTAPAKSRKPAEPGAKSSPAAESRPGLLRRIGRGLKSLVTRAPRSQH